MASTMETTLFPMNDSYSPFNRPSSTRATAAGATMSGLGAPAWPGVSNIWRNTSPEHNENQDVADQQATASPASIDSFTLPSTRRGLTRSGSQESPARNPLRVATTGTVPSLGAVGRSPTKLPSPSRSKILGRNDSPGDATMSHLGTATLLNGSAPDIDPGHQLTYSSMPSQESRLNNINVGGIHDFVPTNQQQLTHPRLNQSRFANEATLPFGSFEPVFHMNGRGYTPGHHASNSSSNFTNARAWDSAMHSTVQAYRLAETTHPSVQTSTNTGFSGPGGHDAEQFIPDISSLGLGDFPEPEYRAVLLTTQAIQRSQPRQPLSPAIDGDPMAGPRAAMSHLSQPYATPMLSQPHPNMGANVHSAQKPMPPLTAGMAYTPSYTPPTAPGSRRSNSGSGTSTRASSQSIDARFMAPDGAAQYANTRSALSQQVPQPSNINYLAQWTSPPYNNPYGPPQVAGNLRADTQVHRDASSDAGLQHEKEQNMSPLMRDFRANHKTKRFELKDAYNHIVEFSGDQHGSRFIQSKLETANSDEKEKVFSEIQENAFQLMTDIFGNYVIQKLFEYGTQAQKKGLANQMKGSLYYLTTQAYGCRVVQKALDHVLTDQQASMVKELEGNILSIVENMNGNHVIQKAIERVPSEHIQFIFDAHKGHVVRLSKHNYGCRVIQRMLEHGPLPVKQSVLDELRDAIPALIEDQFGNYVMQHILCNGDAADRHMIVDLIQRQLLHFSKHKFASNVVEAAIDCAEDHQRQDIIRVLTTEVDSTGQSQVYGLLRDQFGNYVIQKVLTKLQGAALNSLVLEIQHHLFTLRKISHGKQITAMEKKLAEAIQTLGRQYTGRTSPGTLAGRGVASTSASANFSGHASMAHAQPGRMSRPVIFHQPSRAQI